MTMTSLFHTGLFASVAMALLCAPVAAAVALPMDVSATGTYFFDEAGSETSVDVAQSGTLFSTVGGVTAATANYTDASVTSGTNPVIGVLTHHGDGVAGGGDGFGGTATVSADAATGDTVFRADTDLGTPTDANSSPITITNNSIGTTYQILMSLTYDHSVFATGFDAGIRSDMDLDLNGTRIFESELISDTLGNIVNGIPTGGFGGLLDDVGVFEFSFLLTPGQVAEIDFDYTLESPGPPGFSDGTVTGDTSYFISLDNVTAVPEPSLIPLAGMIVFGIRRRFGKGSASHRLWSIPVISALPRFNFGIRWVVAEVVKTFGELRFRSKLLTSSATSKLNVDGGSLSSEPK